MVTRNPSALNHAIRYRGLALHSLASALGAFSEQNAPIILCDGEADW